MCIVLFRIKETIRSPLAKVSPLLSEMFPSASLCRIADRILDCSGAYASHLLVNRIERICTNNTLCGSCSELATVIKLFSKMM